MTAILRRELHSYAVSLTGPVAAAVMLFVAGLMFRYINLHNGYATFAYAISNSGIIFYIVVPVLSMRVFAEERRQKTDQLLFTAPVTLLDIVLGKYLALVIVFALPVLVMALYPLIIAHFGQGPFLIDYASLLAFYLEGCAYLAIGMLLSTLTENVILAAIGSILFVFATQMIHNVYSLFSGGGLASLVFFVGFSALLGILVYLMTGFYYVSILVTAAGAIACFALFMVNDEWFTGKIEWILGGLDFYSRTIDFYQGSLAIGNYVYFLSVAVSGLALTMLSVRRRQLM